MAIRGTRQIIIDGIVYKDAKELCELNDLDYGKFSKLKAKVKDNEKVFRQLMDLKDREMKLKGMQPTTTYHTMKVESQNDNEIINDQVEEPTYTEPEKPTTIKSVYDEPEQVEENSLENINPDVINICDMIKLHVHKNINLIDFENLYDYPDSIKPLLENPGNLNIFYYNACIYASGFYKFTRGSKSTNIPIMTYEVEDELVDKVILFTLGLMSATYPEKGFKIISRDKGYLSFSNILPNVKYINPVTDETKKQEIKPPMSNNPKYNHSGEERFLYSVCRYLCEHESRISSIAPYTVPQLKFTFGEFFTQKNKIITDSDLESILDLLLDYDLVRMSSKNGKKYYTFKITNIKETVDKMKRV